MGGVIIFLWFFYLPTKGETTLSAYKCECGGAEKAGKMAKLIQTDGCISSVGGFSRQAHLYKIFISFLIYYCECDQFMCVNVHLVFLSMCVHMHVEANG